MELNICHLYPDILNLYGDRGNIITMKRRLESRGIKVNIDECSIGQPLNADKYDIFFIGGGQDFEQEVLLRDLSSGKAQDIRTAVEEERPFSPSAAATRCSANTTRPGTACSSTSSAPSACIPSAQRSA